ncbi:iron dicitrate transporter FecR [Echinicola pacifica]|uniref:Iron dicitrate transporter FecR n=1 Tax=Echinicola pacifica TaxID=346377 RepID=A0A918Q630_9BACT|nr:FecR domain-containing protein [Echinicola pacifica]GGZ33041.1 iron dicitrate transporter FecR [Echinicola pacifica]
MDNKDSYDFYAQLISKSIRGSLSMEEQSLLEGWLTEDPSNRSFYDQLISEDFLNQELRELEKIDTDEAFARLEARLNSKRENPSHSINQWKRIASVAAVFAVMLLGWTIYKASFESWSSDGLIGQNALVDADPGSNKAILVLADGQNIPLETIAEGRQEISPGMHIEKSNNQVIFKLDRLFAMASEKTNRIIVPQGGRYTVELPDGSKVWLNSASSLSFQSAFGVDSRQVYLEGEAYFEVAPDAQRPFLVEANGTQIQVLGTHFNVNAYTNEPATKTTLLEGKVQIRYGAHDKVLKPGQQAISNEALAISPVSTSEIMGWKEGYYRFKSTRLDEILRQLERWYSIKVVHDNELPLRHFSGTISMDTPLSKVLEMLELSGELDFQFKNGMLYVTEMK